VSGVLMNTNTVAHDINIVASQVLSFVTRKLIAHPNEPAYKEVAEQMVGVLCQADIIASYFQNTNDPIFKCTDRTDSNSDALLQGKNRASTTQADLVPLFNDGDAQTIVANILRLINNIPIQSAKKQLDQLTVDQLYLCAGVECIAAKKPSSAPYKSQGTRINHHSHGINNYHLNFVRKYGLKWQADMGRQLGITNTVVSPIPHSILVDGKTKDAHPKCCDHDDVNLDKDYVNEDRYAPGYYEDLDVSNVQFTSYDALLIDAYNQLTPEDKQVLTIAATGFEMDIQTGEERIARLKKLETAASNFARNYAKAKIAIGSPNIMVVFGELTGNKTQVRQPMPGLGGPDRFVEDIADIQSAIFKGATSGIENAVDSAKLGEIANPKNLAKNQIKAQVRIIFHSDTEKDGEALEINHSGVQGEVKQPTIADIRKYAKKVDSALSDVKSGGVPTEYVLQVAHLLGVTPRNFRHDRTRETLDFFRQVKKNFKKLRVITDTSWLTAAARNANDGMGKFLASSNNPEIKAVGESMCLADRISNDGFMFFSAGERYFKKKIDAARKEGNAVSEQEMFGVAVMRAALEKTSQSYHQEIGGIFEQIKKSGVADKLMDAIVAGANEESFGAGNFIGMMLKLYDEPDSKGLQDAVPFVWGADDLTQYAERSGVEKHKLYRDQFICGAIMEMLIAHLSSTKQTQKEKLVNILRQMRMGADRDQVYWDSANNKNLKISQDDISNSVGVADYNLLPNVEIRAANAIVQLGRDPAGTELAPYTAIGKHG